MPVCFPELVSSKQRLSQLQFFHLHSPVPARNRHRQLPTATDPQLHPERYTLNPPPTPRHFRRLNRLYIKPNKHQRLGRQHPVHHLTTTPGSNSIIPALHILIQYPHDLMECCRQYRRVRAGRKLSDRDYCDQRPTHPNNHRYSSGAGFYGAKYCVAGPFTSRS